MGPGLVVSAAAVSWRRWRHALIYCAGREVANRPHGVDLVPAVVLVEHPRAENGDVGADGGCGQRLTGNDLDDHAARVHVLYVQELRIAVIGREQDVRVAVASRLDL